MISGTKPRVASRTSSWTIGCCAKLRGKLQAPQSAFKHLRAATRRLDNKSPQPIMSSDSELSDTLPDKADIEKALRDVVKEAYEAGELETLSANAARAAAEEKLGLDDGFLKADQYWKGRSKEIIQETLVGL